MKPSVVTKMDIPPAPPLFDEEELRKLLPTVFLKGPEVGLFIHGGDGPPRYEFEWLTGDDRLKPVVMKLADYATANLLGSHVDNTRYSEISQVVHYAWTDLVRGLWPELEALPRLYIKLTHGASHARRVPAPYTEAYARNLRRTLGIVPPGKLRTVLRRRMRDIQKRKYERWLLLDAKYHKRGPKKPHAHHTSNLPSAGRKTKGKAEPLRC